MRQHLAVAGMLVAVAVHATTATAQARRASDSAQRAVELTVLTYADSTKAWWANFTGFAFDPYAYVLPETFPSSQGAPPRLEAIASHDTGHVAEIVRRAGFATALEATNPCWPVRPDGCRMGAHRGIAAFTPAVVSNDSATVMLFRTERNDGGRTPSLLSLVRLTLVRRASAWQVVSVRVGAS